MRRWGVRDREPGQLSHIQQLVAHTVRPPFVHVRERTGRAVFARGAQLDDSQELSLDELGIVGADRTHYQPARWSTLPRILPRREVSSGDVFIDYGCGMGRVLYLAASRYPFKRVIGVELSESLSNVARSNLERNAERLCCGSVEVVTADAIDYVPPPNVTVAAFYNPFTGRLFDTVMRRLLEQVRAAGHPLRIIYFNPVEHERLMAMGALTVVRCLRGWRPGRAWSLSNMTVMYEYVPEGVRALTGR
jgi:SAM-dependent methyltransferase